MNAWVVWINGIAAVWGAGMVRAICQGGAAIVLAGMLSALVARRSGRVQSWLWRGAYLKCLACVVVMAPVGLPLLRAREVERVVAQVAPRVEAAAVVAEEVPAAVVGPAVEMPVMRERVSWAAVLLGVWVAGVSAGVARLGLGFWRTGRFRRAGVRVIDGQVRAIFTEMGRRMGLEKMPGLMRVEGLGSPLLIGVMQPAVVLPGEVGDGEKLRLIFAHELAHLKRRDLAWNWLEAVVGAVLFFHPLVWWARGRGRLAQELACDELALEATGVKAGEYGEMLMDVVARGNGRRRGLVGVGVSETAGTLRRRLVAMKNGMGWSRRRVRGAAVVAVVMSVIGIVPWKAVARAAAPRSGAVPTSAPAGKRVEDKNRVSFGTIISATVEVKVQRAVMIEEVTVKEGQKVKAGDILFKTDSTEMQARVQIDRSRVELAQSKLDAAKSPVRANGNATAAELRGDQAELDAEKTNLMLDQNALYANSAIRSPIDGTVTTFDVSPNTFVPQGTTLTTVVNTAELKVDFELSSAVRLWVGQKFTVTTGANTGARTYSGEITYISPTVHVGAMMTGEAVDVRGKIVGETGMLKPGMRVDVVVEP